MSRLGHHHNLKEFLKENTMEKREECPPRNFYDFVNSPSNLDIRPCSPGKKVKKRREGLCICLCLCLCLNPCF